MATGKEKATTPNGGYAQAGGSSGGNGGGDGSIRAAAAPTYWAGARPVWGRRAQLGRGRCATAAAAAAST
eukprot:1418689-Lingulodinium_polyedra.AAC.1